MFVYPMNAVLSIRVTLEDSATLNIVHMGAMVEMQATISRAEFLRLTPTIKYAGRVIKWT
jgi:hypothetical protein